MTVLLWQSVRRGALKGKGGAGAVIRVTVADLDSLEFRAVHSGDHADVARELGVLADQVGPGSEVSRAELFVRSGEQWEMAQEFHRAAATYQRALDDGGDTVVDARALLAGVLLELGRQEEAYANLERLQARGPRNLPTYITIAETLQAHEDLRAAHEWATLGAERFRSQADTEYVRDLLFELLRLRYRIRVDLGLGEDEWDRMLDS